MFYKEPIVFQINQLLAQADSSLMETNVSNKVNKSVPMDICIMVWLVFKLVNQSAQVDILSKEKIASHKMLAVVLVNTSTD